MPAPYKTRRLKFLIERRRKGAPDGVAVVPNGEGGDHIPPRPAPAQNPGARVHWDPKGPHSALVGFPGDEMIYGTQGKPGLADYMGAEAHRRTDANLQALIRIAKGETEFRDPGGEAAAISEVCDRVERMLAALKEIAEPLDCGCVPCMGACRSASRLEDELSGRQDVASAAIAQAEGRADAGT